jgi:hypothetical protein
MRFADAAARLAGPAAALFGWRPVEFWAATPAEFELTMGGWTARPDVAAGQGDVARLKEMHPDGR